MSSPDARAAPSPPPAVLCERVSKVYPAAQPVVALDSIDLAISAGEFLAVVGPSGGGKSTLLHLVAGIDRATSGSIRVGGRHVATLSERELTLYRRREVGVVFQFFNLLPHLTVRENVELPRLLDGKRDAAMRARELLDRVDLARRSDAYPGELSGGEMQRAAIARGLVTGARLLLADEPTGNLDSTTGGAIFDLFGTLAREGKTVVVVTHEREMAAVTRTVTLHDGRVVNGAAERRTA